MFSYPFSDLEAVTEGVGIPIVVVDAPQLRGWSSGTNAWITGVEVGVNHQLLIEHEARIVDGCGREMCYL